MDKKIINNKIGYCGNCGKYGHKYKNCREPITSFGIILVKIENGDKFTNNEIQKLFDSSESKINITNKVNGIRCMNNSELNLFSLNKDKVKFLLIQRKYTLGFIEFIRGKYFVENIDGIIFLFQQMTQIEIDKIGKYTFDELWNDFWMDDDKKITFNDIYTNSKNNFNLLKKSDCSNYLNLDFYVKNVVPTWNNPEWGFPKGRRNLMEDNIDCAIREFEEETGYNNTNYTLLPNIEPIVEDLIGTNGKKYRHIYYIAITDNDLSPKIGENNISQLEEIGDIGLFTYEDSLNIFRAYHTERKRVLTIVYIYMLNKFVNKCEDIIVENPQLLS
jgi:8-oxo-dGTP pyrophosphatase MutT (NUDIX family)